MSTKLRLLRLVGTAGPGLVAGLTAGRLVRAMVPAATALVTAWLVGAVSGAGDEGVFRAALGPLAAFAVVLLADAGARAALDALDYLAVMRIDGAHRAAVIRLVAGSETIGPLESARVQGLVRFAKAESENWTERTPGMAAVGQVDQLISWLGLVASCAVLASFAWWLVPLFVIPAIVGSVVRARQQQAFTRVWRAGLEDIAQAESWQDAVLSPGAGKDLRIFGAAGWAVDRIREHQVRRASWTWGPMRRMAISEWWQFLLLAGPLAAGFTVIALRGAQGVYPVSAVVALLTSGAALFQTLQYSDNMRDRVNGLEMVLAFDELERELGSDAAATPGADGAAAGHPAGPPLVRFEQVSFSYPAGGRVVLDRLDLEIRPGELLAVVGLNGAGKSTLIKLLAGLYHPTHGRITADGTDIAVLGAAQWRRRLAVVFQDFVRYPLSLADNVSLGRGGIQADQQRLDAAAHDAGLDQVLDRLPGGWTTPLSRSRTGGVELSGGQWQQVVLARALYAVRAGAQLLVLDEPTAHLDVRTEFEVFDRLARRKGQAGVVLISHRLSTVRSADRIVVLDGGRVTESGTHEELMAADGAYAAMFTVQAERFQAGYDDRIEEGELL